MDQLPKHSDSGQPAAYKSALVFAVPISLFVIGVLYYWFGVANRYVIFLYTHLGATPFDERTSSRYWMSGLVAAGAVMVLNTAIHWLWGRLAYLRHRRYAPPAWWRVWLCSAIPVAPSILVITMTVNQPTLPFFNATTCVLAVWVGLALALLPGPLAARCPRELAWLSIAGAGLMPGLLLLRAIELPTRGLARPHVAYLVAIGSTVVGAIWCALVVWLQGRRYKVRVRAVELCAASLCLSYLLLPLIHYLLAVPSQYRYISAATNFFAFQPSTQLLCWGVTGILATAISRWQRRWQPLPADSGNGQGSGIRPAVL